MGLRHPSIDVDAFVTSTAFCDLDLWLLTSKHITEGDQGATEYSL